MSVNVEAEIVGLNRVLSRFGRARETVVAAVVEVTQDAGKEIYADSQHAVPVDTGNLKGSGRITSSGTDERHETAITYGGSAAGYAVVVHETHRSKSKYLERPAREYLPEFQKNAREAVSKTVGGL